MQVIRFVLIFASMIVIGSSADIENDSAIGSSVSIMRRSGKPTKKGLSLPAGLGLRRRRGRSGSSGTNIPLLAPDHVPSSSSSQGSPKQPSTRQTSRPAQHHRNGSSPREPSRSQSGNPARSPSSSPSRESRTSSSSLDSPSPNRVHASVDVKVPSGLARSAFIKNPDHGKIDLRPGSGGWQQRRISHPYKASAGAEGPPGGQIHVTATAPNVKIRFKEMKEGSVAYTQRFQDGQADGMIHYQYPDIPPVVNFNHDRPGGDVGVLAGTIGGGAVKAKGSI